MEGLGTAERSEFPMILAVTKEYHLGVSKVVMESIRDKLLGLLALKTVASEGKLTERDATELGRRLKGGWFEEPRKIELLEL